VDRFEVLDKVKGWVKEVGRLQIDRLHDNFEVRTKSNQNDLVTEVDELSEKILIDYIKADYPNHSIISEESGADHRESDYQWIIDPLDGTTNYTHGFPLFCISIGLQYQSETILGVIYAPKLDYLYYGIKEEGAFLNGKRLKVSTTARLEKALLMTDFSYYRVENPDDNIDYFDRVVKKVRGTRKTGSAALDLCCIAEGTVDFFWELELNPWDIVAGALLIKEAGGKVITFNKEDKLTIIAGNNKLSNKLMEKIKVKNKNS
jgi:myo-inositol-1(or 4)-monophosphatase